MHNSWLPHWLEIVLIVAYALIVISHTRHMLSGHGSARWWHIGHVLMALGMIDMLWPSALPVAPHVGEAIFIVATALAALGLLTALIRLRAWQLWVLSVIDLGSMIYMFAMMDGPAKAVTVAFTIWTLAEAYAWATGLGSRLAGECAHEDGIELRVTLAVMALGMAYMFMAMQYGMAGMSWPGMQHHGSHMGNMPGMKG